MTVDSHHSSMLQEIPDQVNFYILSLFAIEIPLRSQRLPSDQAQVLRDGLCAGHLVPFVEMLCFFSSSMVFCGLQIQVAARRKVMPRKDGFPHISLDFPFPADRFLWA